MLGSVLKQLVGALGRFVRFHAARSLRPKEPNASVAPNAPRGSKSAAPRIDPVIDQAGLDEQYLRPYRWPCYREDALPEELAADPLYQLWIGTRGGHKWTQYFAVYREVFGALTSKPMRILEIGVLNGAGLRLWRKYFSHPNTVVVGIDIEPACAQYASAKEGILVRVGSQADPKFLQAIIDEFGPFDLIIDDGSHRSSHMIVSFNCLFAHGLNESGVYFVEDLHANYWPAWRDTNRSFLDICKELVEHMHAHYRQGSPEMFLVAKASDQPMAALEVPAITTMIREIRFFDSMVAIYKSRRQYIPHYLLGPR
jgi:SAM-dependent methyltransferase